MAGITRDGRDGHTFECCSQKDEEISRLEAELKTTKYYIDTLEEDLQDTRDNCEKLKTQNHSLNSKVICQEKEIKQADLYTKACESAFCEEQDAHEKLKISSEKSNQDAIEQIAFERGKREEMERINDTLREQLSDTGDRNERLEADLSNLQKEKEVLVEALRKVSGPSPFVPHTPTIGFNNLQAGSSGDEIAINDNKDPSSNSTTQIMFASPPDCVAGTNVSRFDQNDYAIGKRRIELPNKAEQTLEATHYTRKKQMIKDSRTSLPLKPEHTGNEEPKFAFVYPPPAPREAHVSGHADGQQTLREPSDTARDNL
ncbi:hypothetical protein COCC4DRAFT_143869 [Bipolaris maydis ATCC 48331]|uniref:NUDE domain-containing protein n=2 Tax=Cochliobolus heterostrophus TaxID=5016 RepID=M2UFH3_COCH5|nr:uncharacterized protein COCC4DRAFT_143869 [Bipolaris maydis ATCC 48331]EMD86743.1 hypothetical protein COCHEDRAFT_1218284 [Bipolaris maydis C5]KAJ5047743.1 hypothetical protein J3E74DRAFT_296008 [Bipolaris maydis]ENI03135.1 hypothetical protein COCC4DRAFT_143869 [Bipolaris maydis ATCC 48331]KAJ5052535.1 hypothetical protein J3E74DRAFT_412057 [Bipolaris maydis]KAJ6192218.1 hypothetical protein J3E72DRAFT_380000 [Bipolaris maydis]